MCVFNCFCVVTFRVFMLLYLVSLGRGFSVLTSCVDIKCFFSRKYMFSIYMGNIYVLEKL